METQLTDADRARLAADRRTKAPASDRSRRIEITISGLRVERRTWIVIAEVRKLSGLAGSIANSTCAAGIVTFQFSQTVPQAACIQLGDFEWSIAALRASRPANQPGTAPARGLREGLIDNLDQLEIRAHAEKLFPRNIAKAVRARFRIIDSKDIRGTSISLRISALRSRLRALLGILAVARSKALEDVASMPAMAR
jgi:hypothetical protein